jgi:hypothetical protein
MLRFLLRLRKNVTLTGACASCYGFCYGDCYGRGEKHWGPMGYRCVTGYGGPLRPLPEGAVYGRTVTAGYP